VVLVAIGLPGISPVTSPPPIACDQIKVPNPRNPKTSITFQRSNEQHSELNCDLSRSKSNHWSARVIRQGLTSLTENELQEFLNIVQKATFGIFKIYVDKKTYDYDDNHDKLLSGQEIPQGTVHSYFMYLGRKEHEP